MCLKNNKCSGNELIINFRGEKNPVMTWACPHVSSIPDRCSPPMGSWQPGTTGKSSESGLGEHGVLVSGFFFFLINFHWSMVDLEKLC